MTNKPPPQGLFDWLSGLLWQFDSQIFIALVVSGIAGILWSYLMQWRKGAIIGNVFCYLWAHKINTVGSIMSLLASIGGMSGFSAFYLNGDFLGWPAVMGAGFALGVLSDVTFNKGELPDKPREEWTPEQRAKEIK